MNALYGTNRRLLHPSAMCSRGPKCLFDRMGAKGLAVALLGTNEFVFPNKPGFAACTIHPDGRHVQIGFLLKDGQMTDDSHVIASCANDLLVRSAAGTALLVTQRQGFDVKFTGFDGQNLVNP